MNNQSTKKRYVKPNVRDLSYLPLAEGACASGWAVGNCDPFGGTAGYCSGGQAAGTGLPASCAPFGPYVAPVTNVPCAVGSTANSCTGGGYAKPL